MKKTIAVIVSAVMATTMALAATGCGSSSSEESKAAPTIPKATNATTAPVQTSTAPRNSAMGVTTPTGSADSIGSTRPSSPEATESTTKASSGGSEVVTEAAYAYFSVSAEVGATIEYLGTETAPDGTLFYHVTVYYDGDAFPLFVSEDGLQTLEPEYYYSSFSISPAIDANESSTAGDGSASAADGNGEAGEASAN